MPKLIISFAARGVAVPFTRVNPGKHGAYEDSKYRHWKAQVADAARAEIERTGWKTTTAAVKVDVETVLINRPTKTPRKGGALAHPIAGKSVGDEDNYRKAALDAIQVAGVYKNDAQVLGPISGYPASGKRWQRPGEEFAGAIVRVEIVA